MKTFKEYLEEKGRCWPGHKPVPGKEPFSPGSCRKEDHVKELENGLKQLDNHDYETINKLMMRISKDHDITGKELHDDFKSKHGKTPDNWINEDLRKWFKQKWVRMDTKGNIKGDCAREPGEGKPKCLPQSKAQALGKEGRASAARRKRREDPNPERRGAPINVATEEVMSAAPTNAVGTGNIAGSGGTAGEPGVSKKRNPLMSFYKRKTPKM